MATHGLPAWPWTATAADDLPPPEALLLEAMRRWDAAARQGRPTRAMIALPFVAEDLGEAVPVFDEVMRRVGAARPLAVAPEGTRHLTPEEAALLLACAQAQRGSRPQALAAFCRFLGPLAAYAAMGPALRLGTVMRRAGWWLTPLPRH